MEEEKKEQPNENVEAQTKANETAADQTQSAMDKKIQDIKALTQKFLDVIHGHGVVQLDVLMNSLTEVVLIGISSIDGITNRVHAANTFTRYVQTAIANDLLSYAAEIEKSKELTPDDNCGHECCGECKCADGCECSDKVEPIPEEEIELDDDIAVDSQADNRVATEEAPKE